MKRRTAYGEQVQEGPQDTGRNGFREPDEAPDGRPCVSRREFWRDESERLTYEHAVETNKRRPDEGPMSYVMRIAAIARGRLAPRPTSERKAADRAAATMPRKERKQTDAEWNEANNRLLKQLDELEPVK